MSRADGKDIELPSVKELAALAASLASAKSADQKADQALRIWFASKFLIERIAETIHGCPVEDREVLRGALEGYACSDVPLEETLKCQKKSQVIPYDKAMEKAGIHTDETFQKYLGLVLRGQPATPEQYEKECKIRGNEPAPVPTPAELKRDGIQLSLLESMVRLKRGTKARTGRKNRAGKKTGVSSVSMANGIQGRPLLKGGRPVK